MDILIAMSVGVYMNIDIHSCGYQYGHASGNAFCPLRPEANRSQMKKTPLNNASFPSAGFKP